jgi:hypothetical protein
VSGEDVDDRSSHSLPTVVHLYSPLAYVKQAKGLVSGECYQLLTTIGIHVSKMAKRLHGRIGQQAGGSTVRGSCGGGRSVGLLAASTFNSRGWLLGEIIMSGEK